MIGAIVLVAAAIILIPEMLSGPKAPVESGTEAPAAEGAKVKSYTIDLSKAAGQVPITEPTPRIAPVEALVETPKPAAIEKQAEEKPVSTQTSASAPTKLAATTESAKPVAAVKTESPNTVKPVAVKPSASNSSGESGWTIQVGSFGVRGTSDRLASELKHDGFPAFVVAFQAGSQTLYRVRVGPVRDRPAAEAMLGKLKPQHPTATVIPPS